jgi:NitT/TauT family transport system permease protein
MVRPFLILFGGLSAWELLIIYFDVPVYVLPRPTVILAATLENWELLYRHAVVTLTEATLGFIVGNLIAFILAISFVYSQTLERALYPVAITLRSIPIVAVTPLLLLWLGNGIEPKVAIAGLSAFFPTLVNSVRGLNSVDSEALELMHTLSASRWQTFTKMRLPASMPYVFSALKMATAGCVLGAIVAEWIGSDKGLGYMVVLTTFQFRIRLLWATILVSSALAILFFALVSFIERMVIWWERSGEALKS